MVKKELVEELISDGAKLLHELDRQGFPVESMFWVHLPDEDYWRLVIASPIVSQLGGLAGYQRLNQLLQEIELAGITLEDVSLLDPESSRFQSLRSLASGSSRLAAGPEWLELEDAIVYRWTGSSATGELTCDISSDELNRVWETQRKPLNLPALLITSDKRKVTLRFHPQHGQREGLESVKIAFPTALHASDHPDCQVNWLD